MAVEKYQFERVLAALRALTGSGFIKRESFMDECRVSSRTFDRLIADLKLYVPVKYDEERGVYVIDRAQESRRSEMLEYYKKIMIKDDFLLFYSFVRSMIDSKYFFPPFATDSGSSSQPRDFARVLSMLKDLVQPADKAIYDKVEYYISGHYHFRNRPHYRDVIERILNSFKTECLVEFAYFKSGVKVRPLKLVYYNGKWYLIAYLVGSSRLPEDKCGVVRNYRVAYIKNSRLLHGEYFPDADIPDYSFTRSFGIYMDEDINRAVVNIYGTAATDALEIVWHKDQFSKMLKDKNGDQYAQISLDYPEKGSVELISRVLSYGTHAEIISPPELRKKWVDEIKKMAKKFGK
jgi:predicted DNA-binding transcriptional regulator YafY